MSRDYANAQPWDKPWNDQPWKREMNFHIIKINEEKSKLSLLRSASKKDRDPTKIRSYELKLMELESDFKKKYTTVH